MAWRRRTGQAFHYSVFVCPCRSSVQPLVNLPRSSRPIEAMAPAADANGTSAVAEVVLDLSLNPRVAALKPSKTMACADRATAMRESGIDVIKLAAGEPDFRTPYPIVQVIPPPPHPLNLRANRADVGDSCCYLVLLSRLLLCNQPSCLISRLLLSQEGVWAAENNLTRYTPNAGTLELRTAIVNKLKGLCSMFPKSIFDSGKPD